jgi:hypothetical protein
VSPALSRRRVLGLAATGAAGLAAACAVSSAASAPVRAAPWPQRPVVSLALDVAPDLSRVTGHEAVVFTPDAPVTELVFRAWPNTPAGAAAGNALVVIGARVDGVPVRPRVAAAGAPAGAPGTLVALPLPAPVAAGTAVRADLDFVVTVGADSGERVGRSTSAGTAWLGTAFPLLAWVRGRGWVTDDAVDLAGETVTSEDFRLAGLTVSAAAGATVLGCGVDAGPVPAPPGRTARRFTADAVRDVAVAVGDYALSELTAAGARIHVGTPRAGTEADGATWAAEIGRRLERHVALLGAYPYADLWAAIVPTQSDGVEFPTALQFGDRRRGELGSLVAHETAHQWFYALVGNDQATDPWLDESFATLAQVLAADQEADYRPDSVPPDDRGLVGRPMRYWAAAGDFDHYVRCVYDAGAAALLAGRDRVGAARFDPALRRYVAACAHRVATPSDVATAFVDLPPVTDLLVRAGALPRRVLTPTGPSETGSSTR